MRTTLLLTALALASSTAFAHDNIDNVVGGGVGGAAGAIIGQSVGGRDGAIIGGAIGAATGVILTRPVPTVTVRERIHEQPRYVRYERDDDDRRRFYRHKWHGRGHGHGHAYGHYRTGDDD